MKNAKVITLALLVTAGAPIAAAAQGAGLYYNTSDSASAVDYWLQEQFTNAPSLVYTTGLPALTNTDLESLSGAVATDGAGRIAGLVYARFYFDGPTNHTDNYGAFTLTVTGSTSNRGTNPLVKLTMRGSGYTFDGVTNHPNASLSLTFTSTNKLVYVPSTNVTIYSTNYAVTDTNGITQMLTAANGFATQTNPAYCYLSGRIRGNIQRGQNRAGKQLTINTNAALYTANSIWTVVNGTNFVEQVLNGGFVLDVLTNMDAQVIQLVPGSRLFMNANLGSQLYSASGSANTNSLKWNASFAGVAYAHGSRLQANGTLGPGIAYEQTTDTNNYPTGYITNVVEYAIQNMTNYSGKVLGQNIWSKQLQGVSVSPAPLSP
jgi:hypothetical protein